MSLNINSCEKVPRLGALAPLAPVAELAVDGDVELLVEAVVVLPARGSADLRDGSGARRVIGDAAEFKEAVEVAERARSVVHPTTASSAEAGAGLLRKGNLGDSVLVAKGRAR